jgi:hypothetical protein
VSEAPDTVTQFELSRNLTFLAHNYLAGEYFRNLKIGDAVQVGYDNYYVTEITGYQTVKTDYFNLDSGQKLTETEISYIYYYMRPETLVLQTCIERYGNSEWGRLFIRAEKKRMDENQWFSNYLHSIFQIGKY